MYIRALCLCTLVRACRRLACECLSVRYWRLRFFRADFFFLLVCLESDFLRFGMPFYLKYRFILLP